MIDRYSRPQLQQIWTNEAKYNNWMKIEGYILEAMAQEGTVSSEFVERYWKQAEISEERIDALEVELKHDVLAFLTDISNSLQNEPETRFIHYGITSSDILDTCLSMQLAQANDFIEKGLDGLIRAMYCLCVEHKHTMCIGRSHGIHAEPTTFGVKMLHHCSIFIRCAEKLRIAIDECKVCKISGAVGNFAHISPKTEAYVAGKLNMHCDQVSTQIIARDRHAFLFSVYAMIASAIENFATEIRGLQRTEVSEAFEAFGKQQKGSSAMPHKKNPVLSENLTGIARVIRAAVIPALENITLWHERDISHSSVERINMPSITTLMDFALVRATDIITNLKVDGEKMLYNMAILKNSIFSQKVMLAIVKSEPTATKDEIYRAIQKNIQNMGTQEFAKYIASIFKNTSEDKIKECMTYKSYVSHIDNIYDKFNESYSSYVAD